MAEPAGEPEIRDPGRVRARTELAWSRTVISFAALGAAILKTHPEEGAPVLAFSALIWELSRRAAAAPPGRPRARYLQLISAAVVTMSLFALIVSLVAPGFSGFLR